MKNQKKINNPRKGPKSKVEQDAGFGSRARDFMKVHEAQVEARHANARSEQNVGSNAKAERKRDQETIELLQDRALTLRPESLLSPEVVLLFELTRDGKSLPDDYRNELLMNPSISGDEVFKAVELGSRQGWEKFRIAEGIVQSSTKEF